LVTNAGTLCVKTSGKNITVFVYVHGELDWRWWKRNYADSPDHVVRLQICIMHIGPRKIFGPCGQTTNIYCAYWIM